SPPRGAHPQRTRFRVVLAALVLAAALSGLWSSPRGGPGAAAAPNWYLNNTDDDPMLQHVTVVNLYWDQACDHDQGAPTLSKTVLDYLTESIIGSGYFADAAQYRAGPLTWGGGFLADSRCGATPNGTTHVATYLDVGAFVQCERDTHTLPTAAAGGTVLYN